MRYLVLCLLLCGCTAATPTLSKRDAVRTSIFQMATQNGADSMLAGCMSAAVDKMTDADIEKSYRLLATNAVPLASIPELWGAISTCRN